MTAEEKILDEYTEKILNLEKDLKISTDNVKRLTEENNKLVSNEVSLQNEIDSLIDSNEKLNESFDKIFEENLNLTKRKEILENNSIVIEDLQEVKPNDIVTPLENHLHFEKGYNAQVLDVSEDQKRLTIINKDNNKVHKNPTEVPRNLFRIVGVFILFFLSSVMFSQTDTVNLEDSSTNIVNGIFDILDILGIKISPFRTIILAIVLFIIRKIEKRISKKKIAKEIETIIVNTPNISNEEIYTEHGVFRKLLNKLKGNKDKK